MATLTVEETLRFAAQLNTPAGTSRERVAALVAEAQAAVGLTGKESSLVGGELQGGLRLRGLSGGEQRRLSIACQVGGQPIPGVECTLAFGTCRQMC